ncbi:hypothetical protein H0H92_009977, partial [Tricholoma furcatifolium]
MGTLRRWGDGERHRHERVGANRTRPTAVKEVPLTPANGKWHAHHAGGVLDRQSVDVLAEFEVFDSKGGWEVLVGKPLMATFGMIHDYGADVVLVPTSTGTHALLVNKHDAMTRGPSTVSQNTEETCEDSLGGVAQPPSRGVSNLMAHSHESQTDDCDTVLHSTRRVEEERGQRVDTSQGPGGSPTGMPLLPVATREDSLGGVAQPPSRGVSDVNPPVRKPLTDTLVVDAPEWELHKTSSTPVCVVAEEGPELLEDDIEIPTEGLGNDSVFTRRTDPFQPRRVEAVLAAVTIGSDLNPQERRTVKVKPVKGAVHKLNVPEDAQFSSKVHQKPLTPPQKQYLHQSIDEMLRAGIIEPCDPSQVKCVSPTTLAQKHTKG